MPFFSIHQLAAHLRLSRRIQRPLSPSPLEFLQSSANSSIARREALGGDVFFFGGVYVFLFVCVFLCRFWCFLAFMEG